MKNKKTSDYTYKSEGRVLEFSFPDGNIEYYIRKEQVDPEVVFMPQYKIILDKDINKALVFPKENFLESMTKDVIKNYKYPYGTKIKYIRVEEEITCIKNNRTVKISIL